jgi:hypothetical protein
VRALARRIPQYGHVAAVMEKLRMKRFQTVQLLLALAAGASLGGFAGCASSGDESARAEQQKKEEPPVTTDDDAREFDAAIVRAHQNDFEAAAVIRQHTIYPYHFVADGASLNELGQRDVSILAGHYAGLQVDQGMPPATLSVRRGEAAPALYDARVRAVTAALTRDGVPADRVRVADTVAGGDGMLPGKIKVILQRDAENEPYYDVHESSSSSSTGGSGEAAVSGKSGNSQ